MYAMNKQNDVIGSVLRQNCKFQTARFFEYLKENYFLRQIYYHNTSPNIDKGRSLFNYSLYYFW